MAFCVKSDRLTLVSANIKKAKNNAVVFSHQRLLRDLRLKEHPPVLARRRLRRLVVRQQQRRDLHMRRRPVRPRRLPSLQAWKG